MSAKCPYCNGKHADAKEARGCYALYTILSILGGTVAESDDMEHAERVEAQVLRERRQRAAGLTPRGRRGARRPAAPPPARPLLATVEPRPARPAPAQPARRPVADGPSVDQWRDVGRSA